MLQFQIPLSQFKLRYKSLMAATSSISKFPFFPCSFSSTTSIPFFPIHMHFTSYYSLKTFSWPLGLEQQWERREWMASFLPQMVSWHILFILCCLKPLTAHAFFFPEPILIYSSLDTGRLVKEEAMGGWAGWRLQKAGNVTPGMFFCLTLYASSSFLLLPPLLSLLLMTLSFFFHLSVFSKTSYIVVSYYVFGCMSACSSLPSEWHVLSAFILSPKSGFCL